MWNFKRKNQTPSKDFVLYKGSRPARVIGREKRGKKYYLLLTWDNFTYRGKAYEKWVKADKCVPYTPPGKMTLYQQLYGAVKLNWFQKFIVRLQNWWYER